MPIYEYECKRHGLRKEVLVIGSEGAERPPCDWCGLPMKKIMSECTFHLKGCGWAKDGYRNVLTPENNPVNEGRPDLVAADNADRAEHTREL